MKTQHTTPSFQRHAPIAHQRDAARHLESRFGNNEAGFQIAPAHIGYADTGRVWNDGLFRIG